MGISKAIIKTNQGTFELELAEADAPVTTANFIALAKSGFYNGVTFHRYEQGFVIQGGDPTGTGRGGSGKTIPLEISPKLRHDRAGVISMARTDDPNSATSQFFVTLAPAAFLDDGYAAFGYVTSGLDTVLKLRKGDRVETVTIETSA